jgi:two-component system, chemotaxis family, chemotaxis protein CheY
MIGYGKRLLLVDNMETDRQSLAQVLEEEGFVVMQAQDGVQALCEMQLRHFDAVITGYRIPRLNGLELLRQCQMAWPEIPVILFAELDWDKSNLAKARGAFAWIQKSSNPGVLLSMLGLAVEHGVEWRSMQATERVGA